MLNIMAADPAVCRTYGPHAARDPDLEVLLTDGLGGYAMSSLAGVPTRCYSGLVVSHWPPVQRYSHFVSPLERLEVAGEETTLHALEIAPDTFEGRGLELLRGVTLRDLLPQRHQFWRGVSVSRQMVVPPKSGALHLLYELRCEQSVSLTLGGYFVDRDMHAVHRAAPDLMFQMAGQRAAISGQRLTQVGLHFPAGQTGPEAEALSPQPFAQRVYYRADAKRGAPSFEYLSGCALWRVTFRPGGGRVALSVQGVTPDSPELTDPWQALAAESVRRRTLVQRAYAASHLTDEVVATLAVAADAYLVQRRQPAGTTVIAGYPWFNDWGRDTMIALSGLTLNTGRTDEARQILRTFAQTLRRGLIPNHFHDDGAGAGYNTVDGALWLAVALERTVTHSGDRALAAELLPTLREILSWHQRGTDHGIRSDPSDGLLLAGEQGVQLTWMDVKIHDWVVTPRHGKPVEVQGLWLAALGAESRLSTLLSETPQFSELYGRAQRGFGSFWQPEAPTAMAQPEERNHGLGVESQGRSATLSSLSTQSALADTLAPHGTPDRPVRPNAAIALALPDTPATNHQSQAVLTETTTQLLTPLGLHTLSPLDPHYRGDYGGPQLVRDAAYHQGTVWPWPLASYVELLLRHGQHEQAQAALEGLRAHLWEAGVGHVSEVFSGDSLEPGGCPFQAWSVAEVLRAHVLVQQAQPDAG